MVKKTVASGERQAIRNAGGDAARHSRFKIQDDRRACIASDSRFKMTGRSKSRGWILATAAVLNLGFWGPALCLSWGILNPRAARAQQPQAQSGQPIYPVNAKFVQGFGPGYWPTAGSGLTLNLAAGTAVCSNTIYTYAGGTLTMTASATNYVYLNVSSSCTPASNTTGFSFTTIPIATVTTSASAITSILDVRTPFTYGMSGGGGSGSPGGTNGQVQYNNSGTFGGETLPGLGNGSTILDASLQSGADWSYKVNAAIAACPAAACVVDGRSFSSPVTMSESIDLKTSGGGPVTLLLPAQINRSSGAQFEMENYAHVIGLGRASGQTGNGSGTLIYNTSGDTVAVFANNTGTNVNNVLISDLSINNEGSFTVKDSSGNPHSETYATGVCFDLSNALHNTILRTSDNCQIALKLSDPSFDGSYYNTFIDNNFVAQNPNGVAVLMGEYPNENNFYATNFSGTWGSAVFMNGVGGWVNFNGGDIEGAGAGFVINEGTNIAVHDVYFEAIGPVTSAPEYAVWQASWPYVQGAVIKDSSGYTHICTVAGTSGSSAPSWNTNYGATTMDNSVTWLTVQFGQVVFGPTAAGNVVDGSIGPGQIDNYSQSWFGGTSNFTLIPPGLSGVGGLVPANFTANEFSLGSSLAGPGGNGGYLNQYLFDYNPSYGTQGPAIDFAGGNINNGVTGHAPLQVGGLTSIGGAAGNLIAGTLNVIGLPNPGAPTVALYGNHAGSSTVSYALTADPCGGSGTYVTGYTLPGSFTQITNAPSAPGALISVAINAVGTNYQVNDVLTVVNPFNSNEGGSSTGQVEVTSVNGSGGVTGVSITTAGNGYPDGWPGATVTGGHGSGLTLNLTAYDLVMVTPATFNLVNANAQPWSGCAWDLIKDPTGGTSTAHSIVTQHNPNMLPISLYSSSPLAGVLLDYGQSSSSYTEPSSRNTTADATLEGNEYLVGSFYAKNIQNYFGFNGNNFWDFLTAGDQLILGYNTPESTSGYQPFSVYDDSTHRNQVFYIKGKGSSSGQDGVFTLKNTLEDGSGNISAFNGYEINGSAASGHYLRGNGSQYVDSAIQNGDLPDPTTSALGGVESLTCTSGQFVSGINTSGVPQCGTPSGGGGGGGNVSTSGTITTGALAEFASSTTIETGNLSGDCSTSGSMTITCTQVNGSNFTVNSNGQVTTYDGVTTAGVGTTFVKAVSNVTSQTASQGTVTLASSPAAGSYRISFYADQNSGAGSTYFTFNWTDGSTSRSLTTGLLTLSGGYISGLFPIYVGSGNVTYTSTVNGTVNYDVHITLERMQ